MHNPAGVGQKTYNFPDGSSATLSNTVTPIQAPTTTTSGITSNTLTPMSVYGIGGGNYEDKNEFQTTIGIEWEYNILYTDYNLALNTDGVHKNVNIWKTSGSAGAFGPTLSASYNGDAHTLGNWGPWSSDETTYTDSGATFSFTKVLETKFDGYGNPIEEYFNV